MTKRAAWLDLIDLYYLAGSDEWAAALDAAIEAKGSHLLAQALAPFSLLLSFDLAPGLVEVRRLELPGVRPVLNCEHAPLPDHPPDRDWILVEPVIALAMVIE